MLEINEVYIYNDQPVTCPYCGNRTKVILDLFFLPGKPQIHSCLTKDCDTEFITEEDDE